MSREGQAKLEGVLQDIADCLDVEMANIAEEKVLFALFIFGDGEKGSRGVYVANCEREGVARELQKVLDRWKRCDDDAIPTGQKAH